ncbi:MAG: hemerythrin domain-containing protein [Burkholderiaceae bacterium]|nr:hemerythrin domain-containing protein [Burkholderiaceae bacterium]
MTSTFPGFDSPAVGFEQPFEMLLACHERVRRSLALLGRLVRHVGDHGHDEQSRSAASDVLRYFDLAAPLHHDDEEQHVFPILAGSGDADLAAAVAGLHSDHLRMSALWAGLRVTLEAWSGAGAAGAGAGALLDQIADFDHLYAAHLATEEGVVFPAARARMDDQRLAVMSADMQRRRAVPVRP